MIRGWRKVLLVCLLAAWPAALMAQAPLEPAPEENDQWAAARYPSVPTVTFTFNRAGLPVEYFSIAVASTGEAAYQSRHREGLLEAPDGDSYQLKFTVSPEVLERIFELAGKLDYFQRDYDYKGKVADMGVKTLTFADPVRHFTTTYNYSPDRRIQELTDLFHGISNTIEGSRRLRYLMHYDRLGLEAELKALEAMAKRDSLREMHLLVPVLRQVTADHAVMNIARKRAQWLLAKAGDAGAIDSP